MTTTSQMTLWRAGAVCVGAAISIYVLETMGTAPLAELVFVDALYFCMFLVAQGAMIWGMFFMSTQKPQTRQNRLIDAAPALLGSVIAGSYIASIAGASEYFLVPLAMIAFATISVCVRLVWSEMRHQRAN